MHDILVKLRRGDGIAFDDHVAFTEVSESRGIKLTGSEESGIVPPFDNTTFSLVVHEVMPVMFFELRLDGHVELNGVRGLNVVRIERRGGRRRLRVRQCSSGGVCRASWRSASGRIRLVHHSSELSIPPIDSTIQFARYTRVGSFSEQLLMGHDDGLDVVLKFNVEKELLSYLKRSYDMVDVVGLVIMLWEHLVRIAI